MNDKDGRSFKLPRCSENTKKRKEASAVFVSDSSVKKKDLKF